MTVDGVGEAGLTWVPLRPLRGLSLLSISSEKLLELHFSAKNERFQPKNKSSHLLKNVLKKRT